MTFALGGRRSGKLGRDLRLRNEADAAFLGTALAAALGVWIGCGLFDD